jgi:hypothetical protein
MESKQLKRGEIVDEYFYNLSNQKRRKNEKYIEFDFTDVDGNLVKGEYSNAFFKDINELLQVFAYRLISSNYHTTVHPQNDGISGPIDINKPIHITIVPQQE